MADMLERIAKLLNQAENAGTEAEAAVFMEKAQQMATMYSIDLAKARHATIAKERTVPVQRSVHIGERATRGLRTLVDLFLGIASANDVSCTIAHDATRVYAYGFAEDIDICEALYASLVTQMATAAAEFRRNGAWKSETLWREGRYGWVDDTGKPVKPARVNNGYWAKRAYDRAGNELTEEWIEGQQVPMTWLTARLEFQDAFGSRIRHRLVEAKWAEEERINRAEAERAKRPHLDDDGNPSEAFNLWLMQKHDVDLNDLDDDSGFAVEMCELLRDVDDDFTREVLDEYRADLEAQASAPSAALVLVEKREAVREVYAAATKHCRGSYRGGHSGGRSSAGRTAGQSAAERASLGGRTSIGGTRGAIGA